MAYPQKMRHLAWHHQKPTRVLDLKEQEQRLIIHNYPPKPHTTPQNTVCVVVTRMLKSRAQEGRKHKGLNRSFNLTFVSVFMPFNKFSLFN